MATVRSVESRVGCVLAVGDVTRADARRIGAKAANLGDLLKAGFPVPDGYVLATEALGQFLAGNALDSNSFPEKVAAAPLPTDVEDALRDIAAAFGDAPVAVRSSGVAEDLPDSSFAGQYETVLNVHGAVALAAAVKRCWASAFSDRVAAYRTAKGREDVGEMAVLVQRQVPADAAGVAFTANPVSGDRTEVIVSAVRGLGERLVSGHASPDEWTVRGSQAICQKAPEQAIDRGQAIAVAELARRVEEHFGAPQDIEWAMAGGKLFVLQARPITNLPDQALEPIPVPAEPPPGFWERHVIHFPDPVSPMLRYSYLPVHIAGLKHAFEDLSLLAEGVDFQEIGGWIYSRLVPLGGKDRPTPPPWLMPLLIRLNRPIRNRVKGMVQAVRSDVIGSYIERWQVEWKPGQEKRIAELITVDLMGTSDEALGQHVDAVLTFLAESARIHGLVSWVDLVVPELAFACRDLLGWDDWRTLDLLSGLSEQTGAPSRSLSDLARMARERPAVRRLLEHIDRDTVSRLAEADPEFAAAFGAYQQEFGCQLTRFDIDGPTLAEQPELLLGLIRDQIARGYDPKADAAALAQTRAAALAEARDALATRSVTERERFERALARAERGYPIRDEHEFSVTSAPLVLLRYAVLEMGNRLAQRGLIAEREDIFFLEMSEAREALEGGGAHCRALVARRRAERAWALAHPGPASYGKPPGPPPSLAAFPPEARQLMEAMLWMIDRWFAPQLAGNGQPTGTTSITGIAASPGRYTGPVRVIQGEAEFGKLQTGDVLLCPTTSPAWCVLFPSVGALVTDTGGILSHPAIIAREYRIPAIVATGNAMAVLHDGQLVTVDGNSGRVEILR